LTTEEIARAFLATPSTLAQRIVRAKAKIREERIPYQVPSPAELPASSDLRTTPPSSRHSVHLNMACLGLLRPASRGRVPLRIEY